MKIYTVPSTQAPRNLLLIADPCKTRVEKYLEDGVCYVAEDGGEILGACVISPLDAATFELMSIAITPKEQFKGIGSKLLKYVIADVKRRGGKRLEVGTGTFGYPLTFYQRAGFRVYAIERDHYIKSYEKPIWESGIQHKDMLRLVLML